MSAKHTMNNFFRSGLLSVSVVGMLISGAGSARADETTPPRDNAGNTTPAPTAPDNKATFSQPANISDESRQKAEAILQKVTDFYSHLKSFSCELVLDRVLKTTAVNNADFKVSSTFDIAVKHPDKLSIVSTGGTPVLDAQSDGKTLNLYSPHLKKYVQLPALPTAQKTFRDPALHVSYVYLKPSCLDALLSQTPVRWNSFSLLPVASQAAYIGTEILDGAGTDKIKILAPKFSEIIYVDQGPEPWIRQIISLDENVAAMNVPENAPKMVSLSFTARYNHPWYCRFLCNYYV